MSKHPVVHIDIPASDPQAASKFYAEAFDWNIQTPPGYEDYPMFQSEGGPGGGFVRLGVMQGIVDKPGDVLIYLNTDDIEASLAKVTALGGKVLQPKTEIPQVGWWAAFSDPSGNKIGLFTDTQHQH
jgi:predicted enzyme related to lactoylglutathione lyase